MVTIVILALVAGFVALRLYSVLGTRTGHEQQPLTPRTVEGDRAVPVMARPAREVAAEPTPAADVSDQGARDGLRAIAQADGDFDPQRFLEGAKSAYRQTLEAFWKGDEKTLAGLADDGVRDAFAGAIAQRAADGHVVENRLVAINAARIDEAKLLNNVAFVTVRFDADVAAVTRDADGNVVAGSMSDAVQTHDLWTFSRTVRSSDPNWLLVETDEVD